MPPLYRLLSARYLLHRWDRAILIIASIALGVATLVSSRILNQCVERAAQQTTTPMSGGADLYITNGEMGVLRTIAEDLENVKIPGVESIQPLIFERITLASLNDRPAVLIGSELSFQLLDGQNTLKVKIEFTGEGPVFQLAPVYAAIRNGQFSLASELWDRIPGRLILISRSLYEERKARGGAGMPVVIRFGTRTLNCLPIGVVDVDPDSPIAPLGRNFIGMEIGQASRFVNAGPPPGIAAVVGAFAEHLWDASFPLRVNRIDLRLASSSDQARTRSSVMEVVGDRAKVTTPETQGQSTQEIVDGVQVGFLLCSAGAMVVGLFLVYNALSVTVAERRPDIGILRSIGATRFQIVKLFTIAALMLGFMGAAFGVPLGIALAKIALNEFRDELSSIFLNPDLDPARPTFATILIAMIAGISTSVLAALVPAIQAASDQPAVVVRRGPQGSSGPWAIAHRATCATLIAAGVAMILTRHSLPPRLGAFGGMMAALVGLLLAAPILVGLLVRFSQHFLRNHLPIEARLAADNLIRSPGRTGIVIGALGAGVAVMVQTAGVGKSNEVPVVQWIDELLQAERYVFSGNIGEAASSQAPMDPALVDEMRKLPGVEAVNAIRYIRPEFNGTVVFMIAINAREFVESTQSRSPTGMPELSKVKKIVGEDAVVVSDNFLHRHQAKIGDTISLPSSRGPIALKIADSIRDYSWSRGTIFIDREPYSRLFRDDHIDVCHVFITPGSAGEQQLAHFVSERGLVTTDRTTVRNFFADLIERVYKLAYLQQIVVGIVAALGVVTALLISVLQRKRELGLLLAVGATPGQVIRTVLAEAALMGAFGTFLGILIGLPMQWYVLKVILLEESGFVFDLIFPWRAASAISVGAMIIATLAGLLPALHAVKLRITDAIAYE